MTPEPLALILAAALASAFYGLMVLLLTYALREIRSVRRDLTALSIQMGALAARMEVQHGLAQNR
jgi:hypothetical protein